MTRRSAGSDACDPSGVVTVDHMGLGSALDEEGLKTIDVTTAVLDDYADARVRSEFRIRLTSGGFVAFDGPEGTNPPELVLYSRE